MSDANTSGDSSELEALFDSIASATSNAVSPAPKSAPPPAPPVKTTESKVSLLKQVNEGDDLSSDSQDLQSLFDSIADKKRAEQTAAEVRATGTPPTDVGEWPVQGKVFNQVGQMARMLHDALGALGYDKLLEKSVSALPDAQDRLAYIASLTEQAACKVLNATDIANPLQDELEGGAAILGAKWDALYDKKMSVPEFRLLAAETRAFLKNAVPQRTVGTKAQLMEIMMAQDFQDLTGQVIKKVVALAQELEAQLMGILIETMPNAKRTESVESLLNGPVVNAEGRTDVVASQQQVDDLLDSLGF